MKLFNGVIFSICLAVLCQCSSSSGTGIYQSPNQVAVDNQNDRLFVSQPTQELIALVASTRESIGEQPILASNRNESTFALMPQVVTSLASFGTGTTSRLFVAGAATDSSGDTQLNRIRVLDFDGTVFSQASFSPIILSDGDTSTDETDDVFGPLLLDQTNSRIYIPDASAGLLFILSATDGSTVLAPIAIAGTPQGVALANGRVYVCNSSSVEAEQVITVVNATDFTVTTIDLDAPCDHIAVQSNDTGTVLFAKRSDSQVVLIRSVNATFDDSTAITAASTAKTDGQLISGSGISSSILTLTAGKTSSGSIFGYFGELDGNVQFVTVSSDLSSYSHETLSTSVSNISQGTVFKNTNGNATDAFLTAKTGALVSFEFGTTSGVVDD